ncbi:MAG TPA: carboxypeptidase regulatory-like domain-containing protein, partial [Pseudacidobacterium sp.]|nr:carboxypeptidase regulatory-like domain-containing protein [Pseudacidobacterium sp.]
MKQKTALRAAIWRCAAACIALVTMLAYMPALHAQVTATINGTVADQSGGIVPGAKVTAINEATKDKIETITSGAGTYTFPVLLPGSYTVQAEASGYQTSQQTGVVIHAGEQAKVPDFLLTVGSSVQTITVQSSTQILQTDSGQRGAVLDAKDIGNLALESRNVAELLKVLPGVTTAANGTGNGTQYSFLNIGVEGSPIGDGLNANGAPNRGGTANLVDGVDINDPGCNCWSIATINPDMTQEVSVLTSNFGADISHGPIVVNNISKSGGDTYHGSLYFYGRNDALNANDWVDNYNKVARGHAHYYYPGGNVGGVVPFTHKTLFFWFGYERMLQNTGNTYSLKSYIPTSDMLAGNFTATAANNALCNATGINSGNTGTYCNDLTGTKLPDGTVVGVSPNRPAGMIPSQFLDPGAAVLAKIWPAANVTPSAGNGYANYYQPIPGVHNGYIWRARVDYNLGSRNKIFVAYQYGNDTQLADGNGAHLYWSPTNSIPFPGGGLQGGETSKVLSGHFVHIFSDTLTNEAVGSIGYGNNPTSAPNIKAVYRTTLGYPTGAGYGTVFGTGDPWIPSYSSPANQGGSVQTFPDFSQQNIFTGSNYPLLKEAASAYDNVTKVLGSHTLKAGFFYEMVNNDQGNFNTPNGTLSFNGAPANNAITGVQVGSPNNPTANFVMGNATGYSESNANPKGDMA